MPGTILGTNFVPLEKEQPVKGETIRAPRRGRRGKSSRDHFWGAEIEGLEQMG